MIANPLDLDGLATNNTVSTALGTNLPWNSVVYTWDISVAGYTNSTYSTKAGGWSVPGLRLNPGQGAWLSIPANAFLGTTQSVTTVGTVLQRPLANPNIPALGGYTLIGSQIPIAGGLTTTLGYRAQTNEVVYTWPLGATSFGANQVFTLSAKAGGWSPSEPQIGVGQGFWLKSLPGSVWTTNFTVQ